MSITLIFFTKMPKDRPETDPPAAPPPFLSPSPRHPSGPPVPPPFQRPPQSFSPPQPPQPPEPAAPQRKRRKPSFFDKDRVWLNVLLFVLTLLSTYAMGLTTWSLSYMYADALEAGELLEISIEILWDPQVVSLSLMYMIVLCGILLAHEMGHYLTCRFYGLNATLPFFIPLPNLIGTMGAFIRIRSPIAYKKQLFDVGVAGPLAGFILTIPAVAYGLAHSKIVPSLPVEESILFGEPLLFQLLEPIFLGNIPPGHDIVLHPIGFAGWVGCLVTALNLFPIGQLDGGHMMYALFGSRTRKLAPFVLAAFVIMGIFLFTGWFVWAILIAILGFRHPPIYDEHVPLDPRRRLIAYLTLGVFVLTFIPAPIMGGSLLDLLSPLFQSLPLP